LGTLVLQNRCIGHGRQEHITHARAALQPPSSDGEDEEVRPVTMAIIIITDHHRRQTAAAAWYLGANCGSLFQF
jgi:hypothetical protein